MKYIDADKLLAELDIRRKDCLIARNEFKTDDPELASFYEGKAKMCAELSNYINYQARTVSIPSNLEEAAKEFANKEFPDESAVGQWGTGDYEPPVDMEYPREIAEEAFQAGAEWVLNIEKTWLGHAIIRLDTIM